MWENTDQNNSEYGQFSRSDIHLLSKSQNADAQAKKLKSILEKKLSTYLNVTVFLRVEQLGHCPPNMNIAVSFIQSCSVSFLFS